MLISEILTSNSYSRHFATRRTRNNQPQEDQSGFRIKIISCTLSNQASHHDFASPQSNSFVCNYSTNFTTSLSQVTMALIERMPTCPSITSGLRCQRMLCHMYLAVLPAN